MEKTVQGSPAAQAPKKKGFLDLFLGGGKKGLNMWFNNMMPSIVVGGLLISLINETGLIDLIGVVLGPVMGIFGLPGEAAVLWVGSFMTMSIGILGALPLIESGVLTMEHVTILLPMIMATTAPAKIIRMAGVAGADGKTLKLSYLMMFLCSILAGLMTRVITLIF